MHTEGNKVLAGFAIFPSERMEIGVACVRVEELVEMGENGHG
jgi:hypothetical protein